MTQTKMKTDSSVKCDSINEKKAKLDLATTKT